jgi:hypothetical protein
MGKRTIEAAVNALDFNAAFKTQEGNGKKNKYVEFSGFTSIGRELNYIEFYSKLDDIPGLLRERYNDFDAEEEVKAYLEAKENGLSGVPDLFSLIRDIEEEERKIWDLAEAVSDGLHGKIPEPPKSWLVCQHEFERKISEALADPKCALTKEAYDALNKILVEVYNHDIMWFVRNTEER